MLPTQKVNIMYPNDENMIIVSVTIRIEIIMSIQVCLISRMNFDNKENGKEKLFFPNQSINIVYPKKINKIVVPLTKRMEIITSIQVV